MESAKRARDFGMFFESIETEKKKFLKESREVGIERAQFGFELFGSGRGDVPLPTLPAGVRITPHRLLKQNFGKLH